MKISKRWLLIIGSAILLNSLMLIGLCAFTLLQQINTQQLIVSRIIDGDTVVLSDGSTVRYIGIDSPEKGEYFFAEATVKNSQLVLGKRVKLEKDISDTDKYGRLLRYVYVDDIFVNAELVRLGYAKVAEYPPDTKYIAEFLKLQSYAYNSKLGVYSTTKSTPPPGSFWEKYN